MILPFTSSNVYFFIALVKILDNFLWFNPKKTTVAAETNIGGIKVTTLTLF